jgi:hypothetical protein
MQLYNHCGLGAVLWIASDSQYAASSNFKIFIYIQHLIHRKAILIFYLFHIHNFRHNIVPRMEVYLNRSYTYSSIYPSIPTINHIPEGLLGTRCRVAKVTCAYKLRECPPIRHNYSTLNIYINLFSKLAP